MLVAWSGGEGVMAAVPLHFLPIKGWGGAQGKGGIGLKYVGGLANKFPACGMVKYLLAT